MGKPGSLLSCIHKPCEHAAASLCRTPRLLPKSAESRVERQIVNDATPVAELVVGLTAEDVDFPHAKVEPS